MIDIHTHILLCIDDGSSSVKETVEMLQAMAKTGVKKVVATPHYYPDTMTVDEFLENRRKAFEKIKNKIPEGMEVILGAEVMIGYNMHKEDILKLAIEGTDYLLVEMPYGRWDPWVFDEVFKISAKHGLNIIIAHIDRYVNIVRKEDINNIFILDFGNHSAQITAIFQSVPLTNSKMHSFTQGGRHLPQGIILNPV